jgi:predicted nucleic acid-binding protein
VRRLIDCLIAATAIAADVPVLHADEDFDVLARHTPLRLAT